MTFVVPEATAPEAAKEGADAAVLEHERRKAYVRMIVEADDGDTDAVLRYVNAEDEQLAAALDVLADAEVLLDAAKRNAEALRGAAEAAFARVRRILWPAIEEAALERRAALGKGKTLRFLPHTGRHLQWRKDSQGAIEVRNERDAVDAIERRFGWDSEEYIRVSKRVSRRAIKEWIRENEQIDEGTGEVVYPTIPGLKFDPPGEKLGLRGR